MHIAYHESRTVMAKKNLLLSLTLEQWHRIWLNIDSSQSRAGFVFFFCASSHYQCKNMIWIVIRKRSILRMHPPSLASTTIVRAKICIMRPERKRRGTGLSHKLQWGQIIYEVELFYILYEICSNFSILAILSKYVIRKHLAESKRYENWNTTSFIFLSPLLCIRGSSSPVCMYPADMR